MYQKSFQVIDRSLATWDGKPTVIDQNQGLQMAQTPVGDIFLTFFNEARENSQGTIAVTSGGSSPQIISVEAQQNAPQIYIQNYEGNNLNITNISVNEVPIKVAAWGPGFGESESLPDNGHFVGLPVYDSRTTKSRPQFQRLAMRALGQYNVFGVFIGSEPSVYCVNAPDPSTVPVQDYTEVTQSNTFPLIGNWLGKTLWVVNLSPETAQGAEVSLTNL